MRCLFNKERFVKSVVLFLFFFLFANVSAEAIANQLHVNIQVTDNNGQIVNGTYQFVFNITTDSGCANVVYSNTTILNTDSRGIISYYLGDVNLNFSDQYYLCYYRNGTLINNSKMGMVPYAFRAKNITSSGIEWVSNVNLGNYNLTVNGSTLFVDTNSGRVGIGTSNPQNKLNVVGDINATTSIFSQGRNLSIDYNSTGLIQNWSAIISGSEPLWNANYTAFLNKINWSTAYNGTLAKTDAANAFGNFNQSFNGSTLFVNANLGRIGVGTTAPNNKLEIYTTSQTSTGVLNIHNMPNPGSCPTGMSYVDKLGGFCIDNYEASMPSANSTAMGNPTNVTNRNAPGSMVAVSQSGVVPWVGISANSARTACTNAGKHLCTSEEWLAGANINGAFYDLPTGAATASVIPSGASDATGCNTYEAADCDGMSMNGSYVIGTGGDACNTGNKTSCKSAEGVYDMVGNVWEWTNDTVNYVKPCTPGTSGYCYWNGTGWGTSGTAKYGSDGVYFLDNSTTRSGYAVKRGGRWNTGAVAGPFCATLDLAPTDTYYNIGFRCCSS